MELPSLTELCERAKFSCEWVVHSIVKELKWGRVIWEGIGHYG
jgi:hypothetical protein